MSIEKSIVSKIEEGIAPEYLDVKNESDGHNVAPGSETHFKLTIVSESFIGRSQVQRHQKVYQLLADELAGGVHALALHTYSPQEWQSLERVPDSPNCLGGEK